MSVLKAYIYIIIRIPYFLLNNRNLIKRKSFEDEIIIPIKYYLLGKKGIAIYNYLLPKSIKICIFVT